MRAFVALIPPAAVLTELAAAVAPLQAGHSDVRWTPSGQWHLTLAFLGEIDEGVLPELTERLARAARRYPPIALALGGAGRFGDRVLWTRVLAAPAAEPGSGPGRTGVDDLRALAASVGAAARRCRIAVDDRPYRPHLTLARARPGGDLRPLVDELRGFAGTPWTADALHLVRSRLGAGPGGTAAHEVIATWPLGRPEEYGR
jgi:2'-5' RNA ligase